MRQAQIVDGTDNVYRGDRNAQGLRHGKGKFRFANGSVYDGEWKLGYRHGLGEWKEGGHDDSKHDVYKGQWAHDLKHGKGRMEFANGDIVIGTWKHDRLNGLAHRTVKGIQEEVVYKDDMLIQIDKSKNCGDYLYFIIAIFCFGYIYREILLANGDQERLICYIVYWIVSWLHPSTDCIINATAIKTVLEKVDAAIEAEPKVQFSMQCFTYEHKVIKERRKDKNGKEIEVTRTEKVKVYTHRYEEKFIF